MAKGQLLSAGLATWAPNLVLGLAGVALLVWRGRSAEKPIRLALPTRWRVWRPRPADPSSVLPAAAGMPARAVSSSWCASPTSACPCPGRSCSTSTSATLFVKVVLLAFFGLLGIFYISTFIDLSDKLFKGQTTAGMMAQYFYYATPQFVFYIIPLSVLIACMVTVGDPDEEQRARRDEGVRDQPVSRSGPARHVRRARQRPDVPPAGAGARLREPARRVDPPRHPRRDATHVRRGEPEMARRAGTATSTTTRSSIRAAAS